MESKIETQRCRGEARWKNGCNGISAKHSALFISCAFIHAFGLSLVAHVSDCWGCFSICTACCWCFFFSPLSNIVLDAWQTHTLSYYYLLEPWSHKQEQTETCICELTAFNRRTMHASFSNGNKKFSVKNTNIPLDFQSAYVQSVQNITDSNRWTFIALRFSRMINQIWCVLMEFF